MACSICKQMGHNRRTCPHRDSIEAFQATRKSARLRVKKENESVIKKESTQTEIMRFEVIVIEDDEDPSDYKQEPEQKSFILDSEPYDDVDEKSEPLNDKELEVERIKEGKRQVDRAISSLSRLIELSKSVKNNTIRVKKQEPDDDDEEEEEDDEKKESIVRVKSEPVDPEPEEKKVYNDSIPQTPPPVVRVEPPSIPLRRSKRIQDTVDKKYADIPRLESLSENDSDDEWKEEKKSVQVPPRPSTASSVRVLRSARVQRVESKEVKDDSGREEKGVVPVDAVVRIPDYKKSRNLNPSWRKRWVDKPAPNPSTRFRPLPKLIARRGRSTVVDIRMVTFNVDHNAPLPKSRNIVPMVLEMILFKKHRFGRDLVDFVCISEWSSVSRASEFSRLLNKYSQYSSIITTLTYDISQIVWNQTRWQPVTVHEVNTGAHEYIVSTVGKYMAMRFESLQKRGHHVWIIAVHMPRGNIQKQAFEMLFTFILSRMRSYPNDGILIGGDFNREPFEVMTDVQSVELDLHSMIDESNATIVTTIKQNNIDNILFNPSMSLYEYSVDSNCDYFTHHPLYGKFQWNLPQLR